MLPAAPAKKTKIAHNPNDLSSRINLAEALKLRIVNKLSYQDLADRYKVSKAGIFQALKRFLSILVEPEELEAYQQNKIALLTSAEMKLLEGLTNEKNIKAASLNNIAYSFQQVFNACRLEKGESTENINTFALTADIAECRRRREELLKTTEICYSVPRETPKTQ